MVKVFNCMAVITGMITFAGSWNSYLVVIIILLLTGCITAFWYSATLRKKCRDLDGKNTEAAKTIHNLKDEIEKINRQSEAFRQEQQKETDYYRRLIESADDGISFFDRDGNMKYSNSAYFSLIGYDRNSYDHDKAEELIHPDDRNYPIDKIQHLNEKGSYECELRLLHRNGNYVCLSTRSVIIKDESGEILGSLTISRDITELKKIHEKLIKANLEAEASNKLKSTFLANISHEIRTPLNSVVGFSNLMLSDDITKEVKEQYFEQITYNSEKLLQIIGDIIDLSRLESSQIKLASEEVSIGKVVKEVIEEARQVIKRNEKTITISVITQLDDNNDIILSDKVWLKRVLNHLMDNAIKFTLDGSVELSYYPQNGDLIFKIMDTGIGINKENLGRIFEEFQQEIDGHHRPFEGLGIGLTLVKEVIHRMGGKIIVQSEKGIGSVFTFSIPFLQVIKDNPGSDEVKQDPPDKKKDWSSHICLLVDDNIDVLTYLKRILLDTGIKVITANSGAAAIEVIRKRPDLDLILLDLQMPEINGLDVTKEIREISRNIPIIAQTAYIFEEDKDTILKAGCDACLIKPILRENLITVMSSFIMPK